MTASERSPINQHSRKYPKWQRCGGFFGSKQFLTLTDDRFCMSKNKSSSYLRYRTFLPASSVRVIILSNFSFAIFSTGPILTSRTGEIPANSKIFRLISLLLTPQKNCAKRGLVFIVIYTHALLPFNNLSQRALSLRNLKANPGKYIRSNIPFRYAGIVPHQFG